MAPSDKKFFRKLYLAVMLILAVQLGGVAGFMIIEHYTLAEAFYMTVIIVSTVGLGAVHDLSIEGRVFIAILIIVSLGIVTYAISIITNYIMEGELQKYLKFRKVKKEIEKLDGHILVCGYGRNGKQACEQLKLHNRSYVVIESDPDVIEQLHSGKSALYVEGNATHDDVLLDAGISRAEALITTLPKDADNVFVALTAKGLNPGLKIISRASEDASYNKLKRAGADNVIMPDKIGGIHMASLIAKPDVLEFIDVITGKTTYNLEEINFKECKQELQGKTIGQLNEINASGANVIGMKKSDGSYIVNPSDQTIIGPDTKLFVLGTAKSVQELIRLLSK